MLVKYTPTPRRKEKPKTCAFRLYKEDKIRLRKMARMERVSAAEALRRAIALRHEHLFTEEKK